MDNENKAELKIKDKKIKIKKIASSKPSETKGFNKSNYK